MPTVLLRLTSLQNGAMREAMHAFQSQMEEVTTVYIAASLRETPRPYFRSSPHALLSNSPVRD